MVEARGELAGDGTPEPVPPMSTFDTPIGSDNASNSAESSALPCIPTAVQEHPKPMLEVHAPHEALHTWKGFFIHIAAIVVGLFIAVGLEQTVVYFHHRHQTQELEQQIHDVFENNLRTDAANFRR